MNGTLVTRRRVDADRGVRRRSPSTNTDPSPDQSEAQRYRPDLPATVEVAPTRAHARVLRALRAAAWWMATLATLVVLDDLTFGPLFWAISRWLGALVAVLAVFAIYVPAQVVLVRRATEPDPGKVAQFFLNRLELERRSHQVADREALLHGRVIGAASAIGLTLVIGGVLPPILLWRAGYSATFVRRLSYLTAPLYAAEFALLHGIIPATI